jgi:hypothetical protein
MAAPFCEICSGTGLVKRECEECHGLIFLERLCDICKGTGIPGIDHGETKTPRAHNWSQLCGGCWKVLNRCPKCQGKYCITGDYCTCLSARALRHKNAKHETLGWRRNLFLPSPVDGRMSDKEQWDYLHKRWREKCRKYAEFYPITSYKSLSKATKEPKKASLAAFSESNNSTWNEEPSKTKLLISLQPTPRKRSSAVDDITPEDRVSRAGQPSQLEVDMFNRLSGRSDKSRTSNSTTSTARRGGSRRL